MVYETNGQHLATFLRDHHLGGSGAAWTQMAIALVPTGRAEIWVDAVREMTALHLTRRLVCAGVVIVGRRGEFDAVAERAVQQLVLDTMIVDYFVVGDLMRRLEPAIRSARRTISPTVRRELEGFTRREMPYCYLCGTDLTFDDAGPTSFTIDHVWPRAYGGDSEPENLLPACRSCNNRKGLTPSWSLYPVQALVAGFELEHSDIMEMPKEMRFAVQSRAAAAHAAATSVSLKEAFVNLGRPDLPTVIDISVSVDVFNLDFAAK